MWDYQTKACVQTLEGHSHNVSACAFHPELPIIVTGSEDGTVRLWHSTTYRLENTLSYGLERLWSLGLTRGSNGYTPPQLGCPQLWGMLTAPPGSAQRSCSGWPGYLPHASRSANQQFCQPCETTGL